MFVITGTTLHTLGISALTISIIFLCLIVSYLLLYCVSIFFVLTFNCIIILLHHFFGPQWIFKHFVIHSTYVSKLLYFLLKHPYLFCALVVVIFLASFIQPILRWTSRRNHRIHITALTDNIADLNLNMQNMSEQLENMNTKIDTILATVQNNAV